MSPFFQRDQELDENGNPIQGGPPPMPSLGRPPMRRFSPDEGPPQPPEQGPPPPPMAHQIVDDARSSQVPPMREPPDWSGIEDPNNRPFEQGPPQLMASAAPPSPPSPEPIAPPQPPQMAIGSASPPDMDMGPPPPPHQAKITTPETTEYIRQAHALQGKKPSTLQNIAGGLLSMWPATRHIDVHPSLTRQRQNLGVQQLAADEERKAQTAQSQEELKRDTLDTNAEYRRGLIANRQAANAGPHMLPGAPVQMPNPADNNNLWNYKQTWDKTTGVITNVPIGPFAAKPSTGQPRELGSNVITKEHALDLEAQGMKFPNRDQQPWNVSRIPEGMVLHRVGADPKTAYYDVVDPHQVTTTAENQQYVTDPFHKANIPTGGPGVTPIGRARTGSVGTHQTLAVDAAGNPTTNTLTSTSTPVTGPVRGTPPPSPTGGPPSSVGPAPTPPRQPSIPPLSGQTPNQRLNFTPAAREQQMKIIRPVREATTQIFGDPAQPNQTTLINFADLADDPGARARTSKFLRMTLDGMKQADAGHAGAGATFGPVSVSTGGFGQWLQEQMHVPGGIAEAQGARMSRILAEMTPREKAYVDAWLAARSAAVGLRAATGGGAYQFSVAALEQDLPVIGLNANSKEQYLNKLQHIAGIAQNGVKGYSEALVDQKSPGLYARINNLIGELEGLKGGQRPAQTPQSGGMVNVIAPDGTPGAVPKANLQKAIARGYKVAP